MSKIFIKNPICAICGSDKVIKINRHIYYIIDCKDCQHAYCLIEEKNKYSKIESLENCFCPYVEIVRFINENKRFKVNLSYNNYNHNYFHFFSEKSIKKLLQNLEANFDLEINDNVAYFTIDLHRPLLQK